jgi:O-antigen/teichoic acid export membrane protein
MSVPHSATYPAGANAGSRKKRLKGFLRSVGLRHSVILSAAMMVAGGLDYLVNVQAGRWLPPVEFGVFFSVTAIVQVILLLSISIRVVVGFYTAKLYVTRGGNDGVAGFVQQAWSWSWKWGLPGTLLLAVLSPYLAPLLRLSNAWPLWAASPMVLLLFLRETVSGALQGTQSFASLGIMQIAQACCRLLFLALVTAIGWRAAGAIFAQPLSCAIGVGLALCCLHRWLQKPIEHVTRRVSLHFSSYTFLGLGIFALITNLDALFVKHFFSPQAAGNYAPVFTLAKVSLFLPWAIGIILIPKVTERRAAGQDLRPLLFASLAGAMLPGLILTALYFLFPRQLVTVIFTGAYQNPGIVLALANFASTLFAGMNIWLNYALALERPAFVYALTGVVLLQMMGLFFFGRDNLIGMTLAMIFAGVIGNLAGVMTTVLVASEPKKSLANYATSSAVYGVESE